MGVDSSARLFSAYLNPLSALATTIRIIDYTAQCTMNMGMWLLLLFKSARNSLV